MITFEEFKKIELKIAKILLAERVEGSEKLLRLEVDLGTEKRQIIAGVGRAYDPDFLIGKNIVIAANLEPRSLLGLESQGMLLAADTEKGPVILTSESDVSPGSIIK